MFFENTTTGLQQLTYSTILLLGLPFMNAPLTPTMNYPFGGAVNPDYRYPSSALYNYGIAIPDDNGQLEIFEAFATKVLSNTKTLDVDIVAALHEDFLYLYESI